MSVASREMNVTLLNMPHSTAAEILGSMSQVHRSSIVRLIATQVCISRLVPQKGIHLIKQGIKRTAEKGGAFILLGSSNNAGTNNEFLQLAEEFKDNPKIKILIMYSEARRDLAG